MKKWLTVLGSVVGALLLATLVTGAVFAQGPVGDGDGVRGLDGEGYGRGRGSANGLVEEKSYTRGNGYGLADEQNEGVQNRYGSNGEFVDEDGDGLCDVCGEALGEGHEHKQGYARENGYGLANEENKGVQNRYGSNGEFVDEDGDGLCDTHGVAAGQGTGEGAAQGNGPQFRTERETEQTPMARRGGFGRRAAAQ